MADAGAGAPLSGARVAVTGATGFVGSRLVPRLLKAGAGVTALVRTPPGERAARHPSLSVAEWQLGSRPGPAAALENVDVLCHLAAYIPPDLRDPEHAEQCMRLNAVGTLELIREAQKAGVRRVVYFSTGQIYRRLDRGATEEDVVYPAARASYYLTSKLAGEIFAMHAGASSAMSVTVLRIASVYGPGMAERSLIRQFISRARRGEPLELSGGGRYRVDLVDVDDVVAGTIAALGVVEPGIINLGSGRSTSVREIATSVVRLCGADPALVREVAGPYDAGFAPLDITKARRVLGYSPVDFPTGLERMIRTGPDQSGSDFLAT